MAKQRLTESRDEIEELQKGPAVGFSGQRPTGPPDLSTVPQTHAFSITFRERAAIRYRADAHFGRAGAAATGAGWRTQ